MNSNSKISSRMFDGYRNVVNNVKINFEKSPAILETNNLNVISFENSDQIL